MQVLEEKMVQLGIEKDKYEDKKELAEAIAMSETALLIADTHALARVDKRLRVDIHYLRKHIGSVSKDPESVQQVLNPHDVNITKRP